MAFTTAQVRWPGQCGMSFSVLEDTIKNVLTLNESEQDVREDHKQQIAASQFISPDTFYGNLLRRPFQGWSNLVLPTQINHLKLQAVAVIAHVQGKPTTLEKQKVDPDTVSHISLQTFVAPQVCLVDSNLKIELRIAMLIRNDDFEIPKLLGTAKAQRWNLNCNDQEFVMAQGFSGGPWLLSVKNVMGQFQFKLFKTDVDEDLESQSDSTSSTASSQASADRELVENVLQGVHSDFSDVRFALMNPRAIRDQCAK